MSLSADKNIQNGDLSGALAELQSSVRDDPANASYRVFLFQLLCVMGDWDRALIQLNVAADLDNDALLMAQAYRELLQCENYRADVFSGNRGPLVFGEPPEWIGTLIQSLKLSADGQGTTAKDLVEEAFDRAPVRSGDLDGQPFEWLSDADMRLGPVQEAIIDGKYYWVPLENIAELTLTEPEDLRDLVWLPAEFKWTNQGTSIGFTPTRYPGQQTLDDAQCAMARKTEWTDLGGEFFIGAGQKTFTTDVEDYPILQTRKIVFAAESGS